MKATEQKLPELKYSHKKIECGDWWDFSHAPWYRDIDDGATWCGDNSIFIHDNKYFLIIIVKDIKVNNFNWIIYIYIKKRIIYFFKYKN